jgi:hypothetical protein
MRSAACFVFVLLLASAASGQVLSTEVWLGKFAATGHGYLVSDLQNISNHPGYDNQPAFFPDGTALYFTTEASGLDDTGLGVHAVRYDIATGKATKLPAAKGFSPTPSPQGLTTLREGKVWSYDASGRELGTLTDTTTVGYYTRFDDGVWALFLNEPERKIVLYDEKTKRVEDMDRMAVTAPYRVPGARAVTYVVDGRVLRRLDLDARAAKTLATIPFPTGGHHVWTPRGTLLIASGNQIHEWDPAVPDEWPVIYRASHPDLQGITRIAVSPRLDLIALVSVPRDETVIRETRAASNRTFGKHVRTITSIERTADRYIERGTWARPQLTRPYEVVWQRAVGENGVPALRVVRETY